jgi:hypothetical protein
MAKFKPARGKRRSTAPPPGALSCVVLVILLILGVMVFMYLVMRGHANG